MPDHVRDRLVGLILLGISFIWTVAVYQTIPPAETSNEYGPRAFPLFFGLSLAALSTLMVIGTFWGRKNNAKREKSIDKAEVIGVTTTFLSIVAYGFALDLIGFIAATPLIVAAILVLLLRVRNLVFIGIFAGGLTIGIYLVFGKLLGAYLPPGTLFAVW